MIHHTQGGGVCTRCRRCDMNASGQGSKPLRIAGLIMVILALMLGIAWLQRQRGHEKRLPRAKASWLRRFRRRGREDYSLPQSERN